MSPRIEWALRDDQRLHLEPIITAWLWVIPPWIRLLKIGETSDGETFARSKVLPEYGDFALQFGDAFWGQSPYDRVRTVVHELVHAPVQPIVDFGRRVKDNLVPEDHRPFFDGEWENAFETSVTSIADALMAARPDLVPE